MNAEIIKYAKQFRIRVLADELFLPNIELSSEEYLLSIFREEAKYREEKARKERLKQARFPTYKDFEEYDCEFQKSISKEQLERLQTLEWIDDLFNLILIGPPGTGKTHIALAVGNHAANRGYTVAFHTMDNLMHVLKTKDISAKSKARINWFKKCDLIIIDEMGYLPVTQLEAHLFFSLVSDLFESTSIIVTSNKGFEGWAEVFGDAVLVTALLDRITQRCQVLSFTDESYRLKNRKSIF